MARGGGGAAVDLRAAIPEAALRDFDVDFLEANYLPPRVRVWFEDVMPRELEVILPTTDAKLNYLAHTQRLAAATSERDCAHGEALRARRDRFAAAVNKFLDLHQVLRDGVELGAL
ncbi:DNA packaging protein UL33 [Suid alphaherpesvirus 1]|uniref:UL33 n=3 Tax=Suid herpesvirus 1 TaxID=10345 RepID=A0AAX7FDU4_SUHV|nr:UL33 protein [Suid alphaherpesvirus 1]YP_068336.1 DNA packaging protein UL33 [Suid alphaherpesvirus 1]QDM58752.1 Tripartite terminase subunit 2/UL33 protein [synthetic construct]CAB98180.1 UL33 protein [Suid herpesvirus 1 strain Kaplan]AEM64012.1 UL33 protein [Suid alphaherpesvirus 1]AEM64081.1 UL33 protein [Suid alphaherpesvirus 1]AFI70798.1 UL33 [Suid alphaherpesvirus 1]